MSGYAYDYDPTGSNPLNIVEDERHQISNYHNKWNCIIPAFAPFYRKDFKLVHADTSRELIEGLDYYLGHYFEEASNTNKMPIYGSIMLLDKALEGAVDFKKYRTLGGKYNIPITEINKFLANPEMENPRNTDWSEAMKYPSPIPPVEDVVDLEDAIAADPVTASVVNLRQRFEELSEAESEKYSDLVVALNTLEMKIIDHDIDNHSTKPHAHRETHSQLQATPLTAKVENAVKAYGKTLAELTAAVNAMGVNQYHLDNRYKKEGGELHGNLYLSEQGSRIYHENGAVFIDEQSGEIQILSKADINLESANSDIGSGIAVHAKNNMLSVHSSGSVQEHNSVVYNGYYLVHAGNVANYLPEPSFEDMQAFTSDGGGLSWRGNGMSGSPLAVTATYERGTTSQPGPLMLSDNIFDGRMTVAATPKGVREVGDMEDTFADDSITVNNQRLNKDIIITKAMIVGLDRVENTAPTNKPASTAFVNEASNKADKVHTHPTSEVDDIPYASTSVDGLINIINVWGTNADKAAHAELLGRLISEYEDTVEVTSKLMPGRFFDVTQFGGYSYLPLPVQGRYGAAGIGANYVVGELETNGQLVVLRNGSDMVENGVYYSIINFDGSGNVEKHSPTTTEYLPKFLQDAGVRASTVIRGHEGVFSLVDSEGSRWIILTNGTMDATKHEGVRFNPPLSPGQTFLPVIWKDKILWVYGAVDMNGIRFRAYTMKISDIKDGIEPEFTQISLTGEDFRGNRQEGVGELFFAQGGTDTDPETNKVVLRLDEGFWSGVNFRHATQNSIIAVEGDKVRHLTSGRPYCSNSGGSSGGNMWNISVELDLAGGESIMHNADYLPFRLYRGGMQYDFDNNLKAYPSGFEPNNTSGVIYTKGKLFVYRGYGSMLIPYIWPQTSNSGNDANLFRQLKRDEYDFVGRGGTSLAGAYGSVINSGPCALALLPNNKLAIWQRNVNTYAIAGYDPNGEYFEGNDGFGPTTDRRLISNGEHNNFMRIPNVYDGNSQQTTYNQGMLIDYSTNSIYSKLNDETPGEVYTTTTEVKNTFKANAREYAKANHGLTDELFLNDTIAVYVFGDPADPLFVCATYHYRRWSNSAKTAQTAAYIMFHGTLSLNGNAITGIIRGDIINHHTVSGSAQSLAGTCTHQFGGMYAYKLDDNRWAFMANPQPYVGWVGHGGGHGWLLIQTTAGSNLNPWVTFTSLHTSNAYGYGSHPKFGVFTVSMHSSAEGLYASVYGKTLADVQNGASGAGRYLISPRVASGWIVYFTEEVPFYYEFIRKTIPTTNIDLRSLGVPYENTTFYLYVVVQDGTPTYVIRNTLTSDTATEFYIGFCETNSTQITKLEVERFTRLGRVLELEEHDYQRTAHGFPANVGTGKEVYGLQHMQNLPLMSSVEIPTFEDVFNNWKRFSHSGNNQPANTGELQTWSYDKNTDSVRNTTNSGTFIGMVSTQEFGDYDLAVTVSSTNADDDWIGIVLGYVEVDGHEFTLSALASGTDTRTDSYGIYYDFGQSKLTAEENAWTMAKKVVAGGAKNGWDTLGDCTITAKRRGAIIEVHFSGFTKQPAFEGWTYTIDLNSDPRLAKFKGNVRYGYAALSQQDSTWESIVTPEENLSEAYASHQLAKTIADASDDVVIETMTLPLNASGQATFTYPDGITGTDYFIRATWVLSSKDEIMNTTVYNPDVQTSASRTNAVVSTKDLAEPEQFEVYGTVTYTKK